MQRRTVSGTADVESPLFIEPKQKSPSSSSYKKLFTVFVLLATIVGSTIFVYQSVHNGSRSPMQSFVRKQVASFSALAIGDFIFLVCIFKLELIYLFNANKPN
jgi:hypothetical protein